MKEKAQSDWQKTQYANLIRYVPSGTYYARIRICGKLLRKSLNTDLITVAKLRLGDLEKAERQAVENKQSLANGKMTFGQAKEIFAQRVQGDASLKPRTKQYYVERVGALLRSWPGLLALELRRVTKTDCLNWAARFGAETGPTAFNHTISILRGIIEVGVECRGALRQSREVHQAVAERSKKLQLPDFDQFLQFVQEVENAGSGHSKPCAELVRFLAFGGFRKLEALSLPGPIAILPKAKIIVRGRPGNRHKERRIRRSPDDSRHAAVAGTDAGGTNGRTGEAAVMRVHECQKAMDDAAKSVGMTRITHHDLRHLFATRCIESGVDIPTVSRWLGHKDGGALAMRVYGHLRDQHSVSMAQRVTFSRVDASKFWN